MIYRIALLLALTSPFALAHTEESVSQQLDATSGGTLIVDVGFGTVDVASADGEKISIEAHRNLEMKDEAQEKQFLAEAPIVINQDGNTVTLRARRSDNHSWSWNGSSMKMEAEYTIRVPKSFNLDLKTGGGPILAAEITGRIKASTGGGKLKLTQLHGPVEAKTSGGGIAIAQCDGALHVATSGGDIHATASGGSLDARTSGGSIEVRDFEGDAIVKTSGGRLIFENVNGRLHGKTSGGSISAALVSPVPGDVELISSAGTIDLTVGADAAIDLDAHAGVGTVSTDLPIVTSHSEAHELRGSINGGGKSVVLRSSAGSIAIRSTAAKTAMQ